MMTERLNLVHWDWLVYVEMFVAGVAAGAYVTAAILEVLGRGRSPLARAAHLLAFPLVGLAGLLLIVDLNRPERFWHMLIQSETLRPMFKWWSPMSMGSWALVLFGGATFLSFVDALIDAGRFRLGRWRPGHTMHGSPLGLLVALAGGGAGFFIGAYSGVLLSVTSIPGWGSSVWIGALYLATAAATGMAALLLIQALRGQSGTALTAALERAATLVVIYQMVVLAIFLLTDQVGARPFLTGLPLIALIGAVVLGGVVPLAIHVGARRHPASLTVAFGALVLVAGLLIRYAIVMGPQYAIG
jgi:formate-dependent nitrite reductase membrane component NrfD